MHYWYWFIAAAALFVLEMFSGTFYLLVASIALLGAGIAAWLGAGSGALVAWFLSNLILNALPGGILGPLLALCLGGGIIGAGFLGGAGPGGSGGGAKQGR